MFEVIACVSLWISFCTKGRGGKRAREIIRLYLKNDAKSPVTGKPLTLSHMEPDHRIPFSTAESDVVDSGKFKGLSLKAKKIIPLLNLKWVSLL